MGRAPLKMELIRDEKKRKSTFQQRKKSLLKKADELAKLCDVKAGLIIYGLKSDDQTVIWHSNNSDNIEELIKHYKNQPIDQKKKRTTNLSILCEDRMNKSKTALSKLQKQNNEAQYPTWNNMFDDLSEAELREHARVLDAKLERVKARYDFLKGSENHKEYMDNLEYDQSVVHPHPQPQPQALYEYDCSVPNFNLMNDNNMTMADLMNDSCTEYYYPQTGDALYFEGGDHQFNYDPVMNNEAAFMCYNEPQQYNAGAPSHDDMVLLLNGDLHGNGAWY